MARFQLLGVVHRLLRLPLQRGLPPALRCCVWGGHNRDYAAFNRDTGADLIESLKAQGRQEVPAIVRRVQGDPGCAYEVICGARRHWTVSWMRANNYPDFGFLVESRELSDEEAFRIADLVNRSRRDLSDYERACDYARAIDRYYGGSQQRMAERLEVSKSWLSRYFERARLPAEVVTAFGSQQVIGISHGATLAPLLRVPEQRDRMIAEARLVTAGQASVASSGAAMMPPAAVMQRLVRAAKGTGAARAASRPREHVVLTQDGTILARGQKAERGGGLTVSFPSALKHEREQLVKALDEILDHIGRSTRATPVDR